MQALRLPAYDYQLNGDTIFCLVRKKWIVLTPEEWVRQHFLNLLISHLNYPKGMFKLEHTMYYFKNKKRTDITIFDQSGQVFMVVECKASTIKLDKKVVNQAVTYNKVLNAQYLAITNGINHFVWEKRKDHLKSVLSFPKYKSYL